MGSFSIYRNDAHLLTIAPTNDASNKLTLIRQPESVHVTKSMVPMPLQDAHQRFGHLSPSTIVTMADSGNYGFTLSDRSFQSCAACLTANINSTAQAKEADRIAQYPGQFVNADFMGPMPTTSADGKRYVSLLVDRYSGYCSVATTTTKNGKDVLNQLQLFSREIGRPIETIRTDNGLEYASNAFKSALLEQDIIQELTTPESPAQNGKAERYIVILMQQARAFLAACHPHVSQDYWDFAIEHAAYIKNRIIHTTLKKSPLEMLGYPAPNLAAIPTFGCACVAKLTGPKTKLDPRGETVRFLGFPKGSSGFYVLRNDGSYTRSANVHFVHTYDRFPNTPVIGALPPCTLERAFLILEQLERSSSTTYDEAIKDELQAHIDLKTFELVDSVPDGHRILSTRLVLKDKLDQSNNIVKHKARLVIRGFQQRPGVDFDDSYAPVIDSDSLFFLLATATTNGSHIHHLDVKTAYLNAPLRHEIYARLPKHPALGNYSGRTVKLLKAIYGLRQAGFEWNHFLSSKLTDLGWLTFELDPCLFKRSDCFLAVYVDDLVVVAPNIEQIDIIKRELMSIVNLNDLGPVSFLLGLSINYDRASKTMLIDQHAAIDRFLQKFPPKSTEFSTPMHCKFNYDENSTPVAPTPVLEQCGFLVYLARFTRPDIAYAVNVACRFNSRPTTSSHELLLRIRGYLARTANAKLTFQGGKHELNVYADSDFATGTDFKSTSANVILLGDIPIHWKCQRQRSTATSTAEAEYVSLSAAAKSASFLSALHYFCYGSNLSIKINCDNNSAISFASAATIPSKLRHINVANHYVREFIASTGASVEYVSTDCNIADLLTKPLDLQRFSKLASRLLSFN